MLDWIKSLKEMRKYVWCVVVYQLHCLKPVIEAITAAIVANTHSNVSLIILLIHHYMQNI